MSDPVVGRASPFKARGPFRGIRGPFRRIGVWGRYGPRTNSIRNSTMVGAVAGTPGTAPTNWVIGSVGGLTREIVGTGVEDGWTYVDIRLSGTSTSALNVGAWLSFDLANNPSAPATAGQYWSGSFHYKLAGGTLANVTLLARVAGTNGSASQESTFTALVPPTAAALSTQRWSVTRLFTSGATTNAQCTILLTFPISAAIDFTIRLAAPQLERGIGATAFIATSGASASRVADSLAGAY